MIPIVIAGFFIAWFLFFQINRKTAARNAERHERKKERYRQLLDTLTKKNNTESPEKNNTDEP